MATGPEMLLQTLVKALKLEPQVDKLREALDSDVIEQFKQALVTVQTIDSRLARIEKALGIDSAGLEPGSSDDPFDGDFRPVNLASLQLRNGTDN